MKDERGLRYDRLKDIVTIACRAVEIPDGHSVWLDLVCIPQGSPGEEEELRTIEINSMPSVYAKTSCAVVIIHSLCLQLNTGSLIDVAAVLVQGKWRTRMWTYQEIKLARRADVLTKNARANWHEMMENLEKAYQATTELLCISRSGSGSRSSTTQCMVCVLCVAQEEESIYGSVCAERHNHTSSPLT